MLTQQQTFDTPTYDFMFNVSKEGIRKAKSELNALVEYANDHGLSLIIQNLDELITEHHPIGCTHHMMSCVRTEDPIFELVSYLKAVESSTMCNRIKTFLNLEY